MARFALSQNVDVTASLATTEVIGWRDFVVGTIQVSAVTGSASSLTWYTCATADGTFLPAYDSSGTAVTQTIATGRSYPIPSALVGAAYLKAVANAGTATLIVTMK